MDIGFLKNLLCDQPHPDLLNGLEADVGGYECILPLLDDEIQRSSTRLQRLREYRNALSSPMYTMFPELLSRIFFIYAFDNDSLYDARWTKLMFVCRRWHDVALHTPELWSFVQLNDPRQGPSYTSNISSYEPDRLDIRRIGAQLSYASLWPLTIQANLNSTTISEAKLALLLDLCKHRSLSSLSVTGANPYMSEVIETLSTHVSPTLTNLAISIFDFRPNDARSKFTSLPDSIIRENIPHLTSLSVNGMLFNWAIIQGLRVLRVIFEGTFFVAFSFEDIIDALKRNPLLEEFEIRLPWRIIPRISISRDTVSLPRLTSIRIHGIVQLSSSILHSLASVPHSASIYVDDKTPNATEIQHSIFVLEGDATPEQDTSASYAALLAYISQHVKQDHGPLIRTVSLRQTTTPDFSGQVIFHIRITGSLRAEQYREPVSWDPEPDEHVFVGIATRTSNEAGLDLENILLRVLGSWPLEQATHLDARNAHRFEVAQWDAVLDRMPAVTTVIVKTGSSITDTLLEVLFKHLRMRGRRIITHIIVDAADVYPYFRVHMPGLSGERAESFSRLTLLRILLYCAEASRANLPLDTIEVINDNKGHLLGASSESDIDWSELYNGLEKGFVHQGVMYSSVAGCAV